MQFCHKCYSLIHNFQMRKMPLTITTQQWEPHSDDCATCNQQQRLSIGGRPKKMKCNNGRPRIPVTSALQFVTHIETIGKSSVTVQGVVPEICIPSPELDIIDLTCPICTFILHQPVEMKCGHHICASCCCKWAYYSTIPNRNLVCPVCMSEMSHTADIRKPSMYVCHKCYIQHGNKMPEMFGYYFPRES